MAGAGDAVTGLIRYRRRRRDVCRLDRWNRVEGGPGLKPLERLLEDARSNLDRVHPVDYDRGVAAGALVVDTRPDAIRRRFGDLAGALVIGLNVLEWRLAPESEHRALDVDPDRVVLLVCHEGYSSSLAARRLQLVGLPLATDLVGGYQALVAHHSG